MSATLFIEFLQQGVLYAVEFRWRNIEFIAQLDIKSGGSFNLIAVDQHNSVTVMEEQILAAHSLTHAVSTHVVSNI